MASVAHGDMEFTKGGADKPTSAADGVSLRGADAVIMFDSLKIKSIDKKGQTGK